MVNANQEQILLLRLKSHKESCSLHEPISVTVTLRNQSDQPVTVNSRMGLNPGHLLEGYWELMFEITYPPGGQRYAGPPVRTGLPQEKHFTVLPPGGEISLDYDLTKWHWMQLPGTYQIKALYKNTVDGSNFGLSAWTGEIRSNSVSIKVTE